MNPPILSVKNLKTLFYTEKGIVPAVNDVSFELTKGETLGIVGESGCGKSVTSLSVMGLIEAPAGRIHSGQILFEGQDLLKLPKDEQRRFRGNEISMIFQEPMTSLNPVHKVGAQIAEVIMLHQGIGKKQALKEAIDALDRVGIPSPEQRAFDYPHSLSGGMRQRVMIAMALACKPKILICDEPTTALDVTIQAQILELIQTLQKDLEMGVIFISHDLGVIAEVCDRVMVMYAGRTVEEADTLTLFDHPRHPYTAALLSSIPRLGRRTQDKLPTIPGIVPDLRTLPSACSFAPRCQHADAQCKSQMPKLSGPSSGNRVRCYYPVSQNGGEASS